MYFKISKNCYEANTNSTNRIARSHNILLKIKLFSIGREKKRIYKKKKQNIFLIPFCFLFFLNLFISENIYFFTFTNW